ncbi:MAG TPA: flagellar biosynthetic protein FliR [Polyangia bacterium]
MTAGGAIALAAARMGPLALVAAPFSRAWAARAIVGALLVAAVVPAVMAQPAATMAALPTEIVVGLLLGVVAALPFAAAEAAGALSDAGVHPWRARRHERGPLAEAYLLFALALFAVADGPRLVAVAAGRSYAAWPIGHAPSVAEVVGVGATLVATAVAVAAPALAAMVVAELVLALVGRVQPALARAVDASPLRALAVVLVAGAAVYSVARMLAPAMAAAAHLQGAP